MRDAMQCKCSYIIIVDTTKHHTFCHLQGGLLDMPSDTIQIALNQMMILVEYPKFSCMTVL